MDNRNSKKASSREEGLTRGKLIALVSVLIVLGAGTVALQFFFGNQGETPETQPTVQNQSMGARGIVAVPENVEELREAIKQPVQDGYYETRMNTEWVFKTWDTPSDNAYVENALSNTRTVYIDVKLRDSNELIYSSPFIPVGATLEDFSLDTKLPAGEYEAIVTYNLVDDDFAYITELSVSIKLFVLA